MKVWFKYVRVVAVAAILSCIVEPRDVFADALDVWHTNALSANASGIAYGNGKFVAVAVGSLAISSDGTNWAQYVTPPVLYYEGVIFGGGAFMAFGYSITTNSNGPRYILQSYDGIHWTNVYETPVQIVGAAYGNGRFVFFGSHIISSTLDPLQWTEFAPGITLGGVTYGAGQFVAVSGGAILSSDDGLIWKYAPATSNRFLGNLAYGNGMFVATCRTNDSSSNYGYGFLVSSNSVSWQFVVVGISYGGPSPSAGIAFGGGCFIAAVYTNYGLGFQYTYTSTDGLNWVNRVGANRATKFSYGAGSFMAYGIGNGIILQSDVFASTTNSPPSSLAIATYPGVTINGTIGAAYQIQYATNLNSAWQTLTNFMLPYSPYLWIDASSPVVGQRFYRSVQLQ